MVNFKRVRLLKWSAFIIIMLSVQVVLGAENQGETKEMLMLSPNPLLNKGTPCYKNLLGLGEKIKEYTELQDEKKFNAEQCVNISKEECADKRSTLINNLQGVLSLMIQSMSTSCIKKPTQ
jgi:hypothetical protein